MQAPDFPLACAVCARPISVQDLRTTAGSAHHSATDLNVLVCSRVCFEALRRTAPLAPYDATGDSFETLPQRMATVGNGIEIRLSTVPNAGNGVFATRDFPRGAPITMYVGKAITHSQGKVKGYQHSHVRTLFKMRWAIDGLFMPTGTPITDPQRQLQGFGGGAYVNDSWGMPNYERLRNAVFDRVDGPRVEQVNRAVQLAMLERNPKVIHPLPNFDLLNPSNAYEVLRATRDIYAGDEVLVSYGISYWGYDPDQEYAKQEEKPDSAESYNEDDDDSESLGSDSD